MQNSGNPAPREDCGSGGALGDVGVRPIALHHNLPLPQAGEAIEQHQRGAPSGAIDSGEVQGPGPPSWTGNRRVQPWRLGENNRALALKSSKNGP